MAKKKDQVDKSPKAGQKLTVGRWLFHKCDTEGWRTGKVTGNRHVEVEQILFTQLGRKKVLEQAAALEKAGIITIDWKDVRTDIKQLHFSMDNMDALCKWEGIENSKKQLEKAAERVRHHKSQASADWLVTYYDQLLLQMDKGTIPANAKDEAMLRCLNALAQLKHDTFKRLFSSRVFGDSKIFEREYEKKILTILTKYSPKAQEGMSDTEILTEHGIITYSQTLEFKGGLLYELDQNTRIDTTAMVYGTVLNAQTLVHAIPVSLGTIKKVVTIENKANYESMVYDPETLYIYTHGFFSPKERAFLIKLQKLADASVEFYHWSDLDYGGIRIFLFVRQNLFPRLRPLYMDAATYERAFQSGAGSPLDSDKRERLKNMDAGELEELKNCILEYGMEIEQEALLEETVL